MYACARSVHPSVRVRTRLCMSAVSVRASAGSGGAIRARDLQMCVTMYICIVGTSTCERIYMHMCVRVDPMQACARVRACLRARRERRRNPRLRPLVVSHYMYKYMWVCLSPYVYVRERIWSTCLRVCACAYVRVSARRERRGRARPQDLHIYVSV